MMDMCLKEVKQVDIYNFGSDRIMHKIKDIVYYNLGITDNGKRGDLEIGHDSNSLGLILDLANGFFDKKGLKLRLHAVIEDKNNGSLHDVLMTIPKAEFHELLDYKSSLRKRTKFNLIFSETIEKGMWAEKIPYPITYEFVGGKFE